MKRMTTRGFLTRVWFCEVNNAQLNYMQGWYSLDLIKLHDLFQDFFDVFQDIFREVIFKIM